MSFSEKSTDADYRRRSGASSRARVGRFAIEGQLVTLADIGARLKISEGSARSRLRRAQAGTGPVTWAALGEVTP